MHFYRRNSGARRAGALILSSDYNKCLLVFQKSSQKWSFPKGGLNVNESEHAGMMREVHEETGLELHRLDIDQLRTYRIGSYRVFLMRLKGPIVDNLVTRDTDEIGNVRWMELSKLNQLQLNGVTDRVRKKAIRLIKHLRT